MRSLLKQFWQEEEGATAVEYALIVGLIAVAIIVAVEGIGDHLTTLFTSIEGKLESAADGAP